MEEEGPFDGVLGFSQGAALAASLILEHQKTEREDLFRFAVFAGASLPFNRDNADGLRHWKAALNGKESAYVAEFAGEIDTLDPKGFPPLEDLRTNGILSRYHPDKEPIHRIQIPTLHILGSQDRYYLQSKVLVRLCATVDCTTIEHDEDHRMPRSTRVQDKVARTIQRMIDRAAFRT